VSRRHVTAQELLDQAISEHGTSRVKRALKSFIIDSKRNILTIVANLGSHKIPEKYLRGEIFVASKGNLDLSSRAKIELQFFQILRRLNAKLLEKSWTKIYLIPTGHPTLSLQLKAEVYRVTRMNTTDVFYLNGRYLDLEVDLRKIGKVPKKATGIKE